MNSDNNFTPTWRSWLARVTVALMPLSFNIGRWVDPRKKPVYFSPLDVLLPLLVLLLLIDLRKRTPKFPTWPNLIWAAVAMASFAWTQGGTPGVWARSALMQTALIGLAGVWVFQNLEDNVQELRRLTLILCASLGVCFFAALFQYVQPLGRPLASGETDLSLAGGVTNLRVSAWYGYRGLFAAQVALGVPVLAAFALFDLDTRTKTAAGALGLLGLSVILSGGGFAGASLGILAIAGALFAIRSADQSPLLPFSVLAALMLFTLVVLPRLPRDNVAVLWKSVTLFADAENSAQKPTARLRRYQAELNFLAEKNAWMHGSGAGNFQPVVNTHYDSAYPKPERKTDDEAAFDMEADEPATFGLWETTAVELGAPGLIALACVFFTWASAAFRTLVKSEDRVRRMLALASLGACVGAIVFSLFGNPLSRGCGGTFAFFMGLALAL